MGHLEQCYIGGRRVDPVEPGSCTVVNPATEVAIATVATGGPEDVDRAVTVARAAFDGYAQATRDDRLALLDRVIEVAASRLDELGAVISEELGAPAHLARQSQASAIVGRFTGIRNVLKPDALPANTQVDAARTVTIEFDSNTHGLAWTFRPVQRSVEIHPGALTTVAYEVRNPLDRPVTGQAVPSYGPQAAAQYFKKMECFCFQSQTLAPGEVRRMPVVFVVDPGLPQDMRTITLSYTFFEVAGRGGSAELGRPAAKRS